MLAAMVDFFSFFLDQSNVRQREREIVGAIESNRVEFCWIIVDLWTTIIVRETEERISERVKKKKKKKKKESLIK